MPKVYLLNQAYPAECDILQQIRSEYARRIYFLNRGYITYYFDQQTKPYEHRLVADRAFGGIPDGYHVHHVNGIINDNRATNLDMLSPAEHARLHHGDAIAVICAGCGEVIEVPYSRLLRGRQISCSRPCKGLTERKVERPSKEELVQLLADLRNWSAIGRLYGVSDNAVRKWCDQYDLPRKTADWKPNPPSHPV